MSGMSFSSLSFSVDILAVLLKQYIYYDFTLTFSLKYVKIYAEYTKRIFISEKIKEEIIL